MFGRYYTRKQAGVIYRNVKQGDLTASKETISFMYDHADEEMYKAGFIAEYCELVKAAIDNVFSGNMDEAQYILNELDATLA